MSVAESELDFRISTDIPYLTLMGELWVSFVRMLTKMNPVITAPYCIWTFSFREYIYISITTATTFRNHTSPVQWDKQHQRWMCSSWWIAAQEMSRQNVITDILYSIWQYITTVYDMNNLFKIHIYSCLMRFLYIITNFDLYVVSSLFLISVR